MNKNYIAPNFMVIFDFFEVKYQGKKRVRKSEIKEKIKTKKQV